MKKHAAKDSEIMIRHEQIISHKPLHHGETEAITPPRNTNHYSTEHKPLHHQRTQSITPSRNTNHYTTEENNPLYTTEEDKTLHCEINKSLKIDKG